MKVRLLRAALTLAIAPFALAPPANAAFPGDNGKIAFSFGGVSTMNPDGSGYLALTHDNCPEPDGYNCQSDGIPAWSPDGTEIAFEHDHYLPAPYDPATSSGDIWLMRSDGSDVRQVTTTEVSNEADPAWSPDGQWIAFQGQSGIYIIKPDGSGERRLNVDPHTDVGPAWSPDGTKIAFTSFRDEYHGEIYVMNNDGSNVTRLTNNTVNDGSPSWSPDGWKIAFARRDSSSWEIYSMDADGSNQQRLTANVLTDLDPAWSPDGRKIAFDSIRDSSGYGVYTMNPDGTAQQRLHDGAGPDWQPVKPYPRPVGASPLEVAFVQAFRACETGAANGTHGQPLAFPSCSNPQPTSSTARIGPNTVSIARIVVCPSNASSAFCNPSAGMPKPDVRFAGSIRDVRCASVVPAGCTPGGDYNPNTTPGPYTDGGNGKGGAQPPCLPTASSTTACLAGADLTEVAEIPGASLGGVGTPFEGRGVRITDRSNVPATVTDIGFPVPLDCLPTTSSTQGSTCGVNTTANALVPGAVTNGDTAVWQIGQVELKDSGQDGVRGNSDDEVFATQGVFLP